MAKELVVFAKLGSYRRTLPAPGGSDPIETAETQHSISLGAPSNLSGPNIILFDDNTDEGTRRVIETGSVGVNIELKIDERDYEGFIDPNFNGIYTVRIYTGAQPDTAHPVLPT